MDINIRKDGTEFGPHTEDELRAFLSHGVVSNHDVVILEDGSELSVAEFLKTTGPKKLSIPHASGSTPKQSGSEVKRFSVSKGVLVRRDHHVIGSLRCNHGGQVSVDTLILTLGNSATSKRVFGVNLKYEDQEGQLQGKDNIDFDEFDEILGAVDFMLDLAARLSREHCEYTEAEYQTKEGTYFGFYQAATEQTAYISTDRNHQSAFLPVSRLRSFGDLIRKSKAYLQEHGANDGSETEA